MQRKGALAVVAALAATTALLLVVPAWCLAAAVVASVVAMRRGRVSFLAFTFVTLLLNALLFALIAPEGTSLRWHALAIDRAAWTGLAAGLRLSAILGINLAVLSHLAPARILEGLRLPDGATALLAALVIAAHDVGRDARRLYQARRLEHGWPRRRLHAVTAAATLLPALVVTSVRRAEVRRDALFLAGHRTGPDFVPLVAVTSLAIAGRMAFLALPNIALTYVVVFAGGLLFGTRVGLLAGLLAMGLTDLVLSGFLPSGFANAVAFAILGAAGGLLRRFDFAGVARSDRLAGRLVAASIGVFATLLFSIVSDAITWLVVPEFRADPRLLLGRIVLGLAFNVVPAVANGILFAASLGPLQEALRALGWTGGRNWPTAEVRPRGAVGIPGPPVK